MTFTLRPAGLADAPAFHAVMMAAGMDPRSSWSRTTVEDVARNLELGGGFLAWTGSSEPGERAAACVSFRPDGPETLTLGKLATLPEIRGQGIGAALVRAVEQVAAERGYRQVLLAVSKYNLDVVPFYEELGYVKSQAVYAFAHPTSPVPVVLVKAVRTLCQKAVR